MTIFAPTGNAAAFPAEGRSSRTASRPGAFIKANRAGLTGRLRRSLGPRAPTRGAETRKGGKRLPPFRFGTLRWPYFANQALKRSVNASRLSPQNFPSMRYQFFVFSGAVGRCGSTSLFTSGSAAFTSGP